MRDLCLKNKRYFGVLELGVLALPFSACQFGNPYVVIISRFRENLNGVVQQTQI